LLRQLAEQKEAGDIPPALVGQIDTRFEQLRNRYLLLLKNEGEENSRL
jgi:type VI secretion system protein VasL